MTQHKELLQHVGWREWVCLPGFGIDAIKAKIDTGALTSSLHAFQVERFRRQQTDYVRFQIHPLQKGVENAVQVEAPLIEIRSIRSSNGHVSERPVISTPLQIGSECWTIELTLANRDQMGFRMLLGREALRGRCLVDPAGSYLTRCQPKPVRKRKRKAP